MTRADNRMENGRAIAAWLDAQGQKRMATQLRGVLQSFSTSRALNRTLHADNMKLRGLGTKIGRAKSRDANSLLDQELETTAAMLERAHRIAQASNGADAQVAVPDAAYIVGLLRRASRV